MVAQELTTAQLGLSDERLSSHLSDIPLGNTYGDPPDYYGVSALELSALHRDLPKPNLELWRLMQRCLSNLADKYEYSISINDRLQARLLQTDSLIVTWLIESGNLQKLTELAVAAMKTRGEKINEEKIRLNLCLAFLNRIRRRNQEEEAILNKKVPTIGIELEFGYARSKDDPDASFDPRAFYHNPKRLKARVAPYSFHLETPELGEYAFSPSASPITVSREILALINTDLLPPTLFRPHITIGGLDVNDRDIEAFYIQTMVYACAYALISRQGYEHRKQWGKGSWTYTEPQAKLGELIRYDRDYGTNVDYQVYTPFFKRRTFYEANMRDYKQQRRQSADGARSVLTEFRLGAMVPTYSKLVREIDAIYYLSAAAIAFQKPADKRDAKDMRLAEIWEKLKVTLDQIFSECGVDFESDLRKSIIVSEPFDRITKDMIQENSPYRSDLFEIGFLARDNPELRTRFRELLRTTKAEIKREVLSID